MSTGRQCSKCGLHKKRSEFSPHKASRGGLLSWCKKCNCEAVKTKYRLLTPTQKKKFNRRRVAMRDPDIVSASRARAKEKYHTDEGYHLKLVNRMGGYHHGISSEEYAERVSRPCEICGVEEPRSRKRGCGMHIDHDHSSGKLRGTLCHRCNRGLGLFLDDPGTLRAAALYVEQYKGLLPF